MQARVFACVKSRKGQAVVEMAIVLPLLLMLICGLIDFGWIIFHQNAIDQSVRSGARYAVTAGTLNDPHTAIETYMQTLVPESIAQKMQVVVTFSEPTHIRSGDVNVKVNMQLGLLTPIISAFFEDASMELTAFSTMKME